jgi:hypothetical protein
MVIQDHNKWYTGHIASSWGNKHRDLEYINEPFNDQASLSKWKALGFTQTKFTGDMYDMRFDEPAWVDGFGAYFKSWHSLSWSVYRMGPGTVLPNHSDTYARYIKINNLKNSKNVWRAVIFLEPWQSGHYLEVDGNSITDWCAGDYVAWNNDVEHLAANMGETDRYTLQLTGFKL